MTVKQLRTLLSRFPDGMDVFVAERKTEFGYGLVNSIYMKSIRFSEDEDFIPDDAPEVDVIVIDEE